jgi:hypothetical protein
MRLLSKQVLRLKNQNLRVDLVENSGQVGGPLAKSTLSLITTVPP